MPDPRTSRRTFLRRAAGLAAGAAVAGPLVDACAGQTVPARSGDALPVGTTATTSRAPARAPTSAQVLDSPQAPSGLLRIENRPGLIGQGTVRGFELATGVAVDYYEDIVDDDEWLAAESSSATWRDGVGADLLVVRDRTAAALVRMHRLAKIDPDNVPRRTNLRPQLTGIGYDPNRTRSLPWVATMAGLAYDLHQVARPVVGIGDLFDPRYRGRVTMLADFRDGLGMIMSYQGHSPADATPSTVSLAVARVRAAVQGGQIARFTGNADFADLVSGRVVIAQVRSTDMAGLRAARPSLRFVVPVSGSTVSTRDMVIPDTTDNQVAAEAWMQWIYDPPNYAAMIGQVGATAVLADLHDDLARIGGPAAVDPLIDPPPSVWARLSGWPDLDPVTEAAYATAYAHASG